MSQLFKEKNRLWLKSVALAHGRTIFLQNTLPPSEIILVAKFSSNLPWSKGASAPLHVMQSVYYVTCKTRQRTMASAIRRASLLVHLMIFHVRLNMLQKLVIGFENIPNEKLRSKNWQRNLSRKMMTSLTSPPRQLKKNPLILTHAIRVKRIMVLASQEDVLGNYFVERKKNWNSRATW